MIAGVGEFVFCEELFLGADVAFDFSFSVDFFPGYVSCGWHAGGSWLVGWRLAVGGWLFGGWWLAVDWYSEGCVL